ncbi:MAG TPA: helix-turn-helix domain-containing protein [Chloroflexota bacterium]|jgi:purine catabolism regulator
MPTLEELLRDGLSVDADVLAGAAHLGRQVSWVVRLRARAPALPPMTGGELVLAWTPALHSLDARPSLSNVIEQVVELGGAALVAIGSIEPGAELIAEQLQLPLILLHNSPRPEALELELQHWLVQRKLDAQRELSSLHLELNSLALAGGFPALMERTTRLTGKSAVLLGPDWAVRLCRQPAGSSLAPDVLDAALAANRPAAERWARDLRDNGSASLARLETSELGLVQLVAGVRDGVGTGAYLALIGAAADVSERDTDALLAAAAAGSIELVREHANEAARDAVEGGLLDQLADGDVDDDAALLRRASRLGFDLAQPHLALAWSSRDADLIDSLRSIASEGPLLAGTHDEHVLALVPTRQSGERAIGLARDWHRAKDSLSVGVSGPVAGVHELARALAEARQALDLGQQLFGVEQLVAFSQLGIFTFLLRSHAADALHAFHAQTLGELAAYDEARGAELLPTLEAYFASRCSPDATAKRLHLHRNSLLYRLRRIEEIGGLRLQDPETRLQLQLALHVRQILPLARPCAHCTRAAPRVRTPAT